MPGPRAADARRARTRSTSWPRELADARSVLFLGRHAGFPVALEGALKLKELAYIHAEGFAAGELKHGPIALIEEGLPVFCVVPPRGRDQLHDKMISGIQEIRARGARTIVLAEEGDDAVAPYADAVIRLPQVADAAAAAGGGRAAAAVRLRAGHRHGPRRRPAAQPGQVRHGRVASRVIIGRRHRRGRHRAVRRSRCERTPALRERLFTAGRGDRPLASLAARFAAKEALAKALGAPVGLAWHDAEVVSEESGRPRFELRGTVRGAGRGAGVRRHVHLSLSHDAGIASAVVVLEG